VPTESDMTPVDRRDFLKSTSAAGLGLWAGARAPDAADANPSAPAPVPRRGPPRSPNEKVVVAAIGLNSRGNAVGVEFARTPNVEVGYLCDVDSRVLQKRVTEFGALPNNAPRGVGDFRRVLDDKDVDAVLIATPDHWHAPMAILALAAGKHVYVEKPCSHNPREGELLVEAQRRYRRVVQMGTQQRSSVRTAEVIREIGKGLIGRPYQARAWYANTRGTIGRGQPAPVPEWLNYELWQGPAPRTPYRDNVVHYNWHWFTRWGTGEICNNGTHELDVARWALGVDYPVRVTSSGGRYAFDDDWEFPDTQEVSFEFDGGRQIVWQGRSCNGFGVDGHGRGTSVHGTEGTALLDRSGYTVYDTQNNVILASIGAESRDPLNAVGADRLTVWHVANFIAAIRTGAPLNAPIDEGHKSTLLGHLGNIAQRTGRTLRIDPTTGRIVDDKRAMRLWDRDYAPGWKPIV
jgi:predicted dehydrogenase